MHLPHLIDFTSVYETFRWPLLCNILGQENGVNQAGNGGREMKTRKTERVPWIWVATLAFSLVLIACGAALASEVERQIPVVRDSAGSGLTMEISREGSRQTATPFLTLNEPTVQRIEERIAKHSAGLTAKQIPSGTTREGNGRTETKITSMPQPPQEITARSVKGFLKEMRASRKEKPAPVVVAPAPEERLGRNDSSLSGSN
jgi:hypothetical protein